MKLKFDWTLFTTALRTLGALMVGNVFVSVALLGNRNWLNLALLFAFGAAIIIASSISRKA